MKQYLHLLAWSAAIAVVLYIALRPDGGVIYGNHLTCLGLGLIGLGLCKEARKRMTPCADPATHAPGD